MSICRPKNALIYLNMSLEWYFGRVGLSSNDALPTRYSKWVRHDQNTKSSVYHFADTRGSGSSISRRQKGSFFGNSERCSNTLWIFQPRWLWHCRSWYEPAVSVRTLKPWGFYSYRSCLSGRLDINSTVRLTSWRTWVPAGGNKVAMDITIRRCFTLLYYLRS